jgi:hypothetical protein
MQHQALAIAEQIGDRRMAVCALTNLGLIACARHDYQASWQHYQRSVALAVKVGERRAVYESLGEIAAPESRRIGRIESLGCSARSRCSAKPSARPCRAAT